MVAVVLAAGGYFLWTTYNPAVAVPPADTTGTPGTGAVETPTTTGTGSQAPQAKAPTVTTDVNAFPSDTTVVVSGSITPNGASTNYWYEYGTSASFGSKTATQNVGSGFGVIPAPLYITGLVKDTNYSFRLVAQNQYGTVQGATQSFKTTVGTPAPVGSVPVIKTLAATGVSRTSATVNGEVTPNKSATKYWFEYGDTPTLGHATSLQSVGDGTAKVSATLDLSDLAPGTTYQYRINAQNQFGTVNGAILTFKTSGAPLVVVPVATTQVTTVVGSTTATFRGTVNPYGAATTYWFEYGTDSNFGSDATKTTTSKSAGAGATTVSVEANVSSLKSKTTYYYRTVAKNSAGTVRGATLTVKTN